MYPFQDTLYYYGVHLDCIVQEMMIHCLVNEKYFYTVVMVTLYT